MKKWIPDLLVVILLLIPFLYLFETYSSLPAVVPTHFGIDGKPNGYIINRIWYGSLVS
jgi:uncharacterized membrane protein